mgnify:CR=1 FL=1
MAREDNLDIIKTSEQAKAKGARGGKASGETKRQRKNFQAAAEAILGMGTKAGTLYSTDEIVNLGTLIGKNITVQEAIIIAQVQRALKGDIRAAEFVRDSAGQKPVERSDVALDLPIIFAGEAELED